MRSQIRKINPFTPNSPAESLLFAGRLYEIETIHRALKQTKANYPQNFLILGERGIGKSSLMNLAKFHAQGGVKIDSNRFNFLVLEIDISKDTDQYSLIKKIEIALERKLAKTETARRLFKEVWKFINSVDSKIFKFKDREIDRDLIFDNFTYSLSDTTKRITRDGKEFNLTSPFDGILILIDEADKATSELDIGSFIKIITERLQKEGAKKVIFGLAGLPDLHQILINSHPSSIRLFEPLSLDRLNTKEMKEILSKILIESRNINGYSTIIDDKAENQLLAYAEGFPHFLHQYGYCAFEECNGFKIAYEDVNRGAFGSLDRGKGGAIDIIGQKYYKNDFYNKIQTDNYRKILAIMASKLDDWITKNQIKQKFDGSDSTLNNAISALKSKGVILPKEGKKGVYKLADKGFAWWIRVYTDYFHDADWIYVP